MNGPFFENLTYAGTWTNTPQDPAHNGPHIGNMVINGVTMPGRPSPAGYSISIGQVDESARMAETLGMPLSPGTVPVSFDKAEVRLGEPRSDAAFGAGGLVPIIAGGRGFDAKNEYRPGVPAGAPERGEPKSEHQPFLEHRSSNAYKELETYGLEGFTLVGFDNDSGDLFVFVQGEDSPMLTLDQMRDHLLSLGVDEAVALDSGGSSTLVVDDQVLAAPDIWRNTSAPFGIQFQVDRKSRPEP